MEWIEVKIHTTNEVLEPVSNILIELGANGVVHENANELLKNDRLGEFYALNPKKYPKNGIYIKAYFVKNEHFPKLLKKIKTKINELETFGFHVGANHIQTNVVVETDWENAWKKHFKPIKITRKFVVVPSWETYQPEDEQIEIIKIDPGMAFGTGTHPTTILSIQALEETVKHDDIVLDVGSGSGILSIASVLLGAKQVYAYDYDHIAVKSTIENQHLNGIDHIIQAQQNDLLRGVNQKANVIVSNTLAHILLRLIEDVSDNLVDDGYFILSGIIEGKKQQVIDCLEAYSFHIIKENRMDNWISLIAQKL